MLQEVLCRPGESEKPLRDQQYWLLEMLDRTQNCGSNFVVQQACARWSVIDREFMFEQIHSEQFPLLIDAEKRYEALRRSLVGLGFVESDMDF